MSEKKERPGAVAQGDELPTNLVPALTSFVGREAEIETVRGLLDDARLLTVTGPPGAGKTRLASEVARRLLARFEDGVWFVGLAPIIDPRLMLPTMAGVLGMHEAPDRPLIDALGAHLKTRRLMVVLDNFEHIVDAATQIPTLLAAAPGLTVLVTSRTLLHLSGEHEYALPPLGFPKPGENAGEATESESVDLFIRRAMASLPTFGRGEDIGSRVGELCRRLDGLPLAIELAAARVKLMPLQAILERLDNRLELLTDGPRDVPARHRSLRAAVAWSYDLLEAPAQRLFRALSVFRGGWTIDGALAVSGRKGATGGEVLATLASLLDASLLVRQSGAEAPRFTMLETLRQFAAERLDEAGEAHAARDRHAAHCLQMVGREEPELTGSDRAAALDRVSIEHDNLRAALEHLVATKPDDALRLAAGVWRFWQTRGHLVEGGRWLTIALTAAGEDAPQELRRKAISAAGGLAYWRGNMAEAQLYYRQALALQRGIGDPIAIADTLYDTAFALAPFNRPAEDPDLTAEAVRHAEEAESLYRKESHEAGIVRSGWLVGTLMLYQDMDRARSLLEASVERFRAMNDPFGLGWALRTYGLALLGSADSAAAANAFGEALGLFTAAQDGSAMGMLLDDFADTARADGEGVRAARLKGAAATMRHTTEAEVANASDAPWVKGTPLKDLIDAAALEQAWAEGQAMSQAEAIAYALRTDVPGMPEGALRVNALGPFRAERSGQLVSQWGGPKAGSRQAQAIFGFLLDRGERGVTKDEVIEVIWPDADVKQGDLNFHRTIGGLRTTLEPARAPGSKGAVFFANGRYRLSPSIVGWLDAAEFDRRLSNAAESTDDVAAIRGLEAARALYRGDYLDDCPLYGDSEYVEERRRFLRGRLTDALVDLGRRYERQGDPSLAAARFREALSVAGGDCPSAAEGLERLGVGEG